MHKFLTQGVSFCVCVRVCLCVSEHFFLWMFKSARVFINLLFMRRQKEEGIAAVALHFCSVLVFCCCRWYGLFVVVFGWMGMSCRARAFQTTHFWLFGSLQPAIIRWIIIYFSYSRQRWPVGWTDGHNVVWRFVIYLFKLSFILCWLKPSLAHSLTLWLASFTF